FVVESVAEFVVESVAEFVVGPVVEFVVGPVVEFVIGYAVGFVAVCSQRAVGPVEPEVGMIVLLLQHHVSSSTYSQVPLWTQV
ncbi:MAG: hypothetical protein K8R17_02600, partial [Methanosarcinales archaeon]|nr:hypothetical protein [Methanosarcinales archaeon]